jgi:[acyl-carrier-protein] S-malonyltransferase
MGRTLAHACPESRGVFEAADGALGFALSALCFEGSAADLARTENTQPAVLAASIAALRALESRGVRADAAAGHSLGEFSAYVAAGTLSFADAVRAVRQRGAFMQDAVAEGEGAMAAILGLDAASVERECGAAAQGETVSAANLNAPDQVVIAGHRAAVERAVERLRAAGARRAVPLAVSAPFHCALMAPAARRLAAVLDGMAIADPRFPVYRNVDARPVRTAADARDGLVRQVDAPVRWQQVVESMVDDGIDTFVEIGPGNVLAGLLRRIRPEARAVQVSEAADLGPAVAALGGAA